MGPGEAQRVSATEGPSLKRRVLDRPLDVEIGVVPHDSDFRLRVIVIRALVLEVGDLGQHQEPVRVSRRDPHLALIGVRERRADPTRERRRLRIDVGRDVEHFASSDAHELALGPRGLQV
jgi:hypothetical protein